ncbi:hypothetical protein TSOC_003193 [Tetrabaena socialis]|uniref:Guanylate cyclase domain-containing protein n=1 Tax=Tetrabaena socialis TaxID=47790 RepID=A0A2J8AC65_9CHLO|nr:hypothetical protein TSOC_003193 [Tetrabaena socialis]|eukprot:PNH10110.1 hypothetical protein TSOC_003193 [Tetrabaena socialis]
MRQYLLQQITTAFPTASGHPRASLGLVRALARPGGGAELWDPCGARAAGVVCWDRVGPVPAGCTHWEPDPLDLLGQARAGVTSHRDLAFDPEKGAVDAPPPPRSQGSCCGCDADDGPATALLVGSSFLTVPPPPLPPLPGVEAALPPTADPCPTGVAAADPGREPPPPPPPGVQLPELGLNRRAGALRVPYHPKLQLKPQGVYASNEEKHSITFPVGSGHADSGPPAVTLVSPAVALPGLHGSTSAPVPQHTPVQPSSRSRSPTPRTQGTMRADRERNGFFLRGASSESASLSTAPSSSLSDALRPARGEGGKTVLRTEPDRPGSPGSNSGGGGGSGDCPHAPNPPHIASGSPPQPPGAPPQPPGPHPARSGQQPQPPPLVPAANAASRDRSIRPSTPGALRTEPPADGPPLPPPLVLAPCARAAAASASPEAAAAAVPSAGCPVVRAPRGPGSRLLSCARLVTPDVTSTRMVASNQACSDLSPLLYGSSSLDWQSYLPYYMKVDAVYNGSVVGLPTQGTIALLYYRRDVFGAAGLPPPRTWTEAVAAAELFNGTDLDGDGVANDYGICLWQPASCSATAAAGLALTAVLASLAQSGGSTAGLYFQARASTLLASPDIPLSAVAWQTRAAFNLTFTPASLADSVRQSYVSSIVPYSAVAPMPPPPPQSAPGGGGSIGATTPSPPSSSRSNGRTWLPAAVAGAAAGASLLAAVVGFAVWATRRRRGRAARAEGSRVIGAPGVGPETTLCITDIQVPSRGRGLADVCRPVWVSDSAISATALGGVGGAGPAASGWGGGGGGGPDGGGAGGGPVVSGGGGAAPGISAPLSMLLYSGAPDAAAGYGTGGYGTDGYGAGGDAGRGEADGSQLLVLGNGADGDADSDSDGPGEAAAGGRMRWSGAAAAVPPPPPPLPPPPPPPAPPPLSPTSPPPLSPPSSPSAAYPLFRRPSLLGSLLVSSVRRAGRHGSGSGSGGGAAAAASADASAGGAATSGSKSRLGGAQARRSSEPAAAATAAAPAPPLPGAAANARSGGDRGDRGGSGGGVSGSGGIGGSGAKSSSRRAHSGQPSSRRSGSSRPSSRLGSKPLGPPPSAAEAAALRAAAAAIVAAHADALSLYQGPAVGSSRAVERRSSLAPTLLEAMLDASTASGAESTASEGGSNGRGGGRRSPLASPLERCTAVAAAARRGSAPAVAAVRRGSVTPTAALMSRLAAAGYARGSGGGGDVGGDGSGGSGGGAGRGGRDSGAGRSSKDGGGGGGRAEDATRRSGGGGGRGEDVARRSSGGGGGASRAAEVAKAGDAAPVRGSGSPRKKSGDGAGGGGGGPAARGNGGGVPAGASGTTAAAAAGRGGAAGDVELAAMTVSRLSGGGALGCGGGGGAGGGGAAEAEARHSTSWRALLVSLLRPWGGSGGGSRSELESGATEAAPLPLVLPPPPPRWQQPPRALPGDAPAVLAEEQERTSQPRGSRVGRGRNRRTSQAKQGRTGRGRERESDSQTLVLAGLRVRMGCHSGIAQAGDVSYSHRMCRTHYSGVPMATAKAVAGAATGGMVLVSAETHALLTAGAVPGQSHVSLKVMPCGLDGGNSGGKRSGSRRRRGNAAAGSAAADSGGGGGGGGALRRAALFWHGGVAVLDEHLPPLEVFMAATPILLPRWAVLPPPNVAPASHGGGGGSGSIGPPPVVAAVPRLVAAGVLSAPVGPLAVAAVAVEGAAAVAAWNEGVWRQSSALLWREAARLAAGLGGFLATTRAAATCPPPRAQQQQQPPLALARPLSPPLYGGASRPSPPPPPTSHDLDQDRPSSAAARSSQHTNRGGGGRRPGRAHAAPGTLYVAVFPTSLAAVQFCAGLVAYGLLAPWPAALMLHDSGREVWGWGQAEEEDAGGGIGAGGGVGQVVSTDALPLHGHRLLQPAPSHPRWRGLGFGRRTPANSPLQHARTAAAALEVDTSAAPPVSSLLSGFSLPSPVSPSTAASSPWQAGSGSVRSGKRLWARLRRRLGLGPPRSSAAVAPYATSSWDDRASSPGGAAPPDPAARGTGAVVPPANSTAGYAAGAAGASAGEAAPPSDRESGGGGGSDGGMVIGRAAAAAAARAVPRRLHVLSTANYRSGDSVVSEFQYDSGSANDSQAAGEAEAAGRGDEDAAAGTAVMRMSDPPREAAEGEARAEWAREDGGGPRDARLRAAMLASEGRGSGSSGSAVQCTPRQHAMLPQLPMGQKTGYSGYLVQRRITTAADDRAGHAAGLGGGGGSGLPAASSAGGSAAGSNLFGLAGSGIFLGGALAVPAAASSGNSMLPPGSSSTFGAAAAAFWAELGGASSGQQQRRGVPYWAGGGGGEVAHDAAGWPPPQVSGQSLPGEGGRIGLGSPAVNTESAAAAGRVAAATYGGPYGDGAASLPLPRAHRPGASYGGGAQGAAGGRLSLTGFKNPIYDAPPPPLYDPRTASGSSSVVPWGLAEAGGGSGAGVGMTPTPSFGAADTPSAAVLAGLTAAMAMPPSPFHSAVLPPRCGSEVLTAVTLPDGGGDALATASAPLQKLLYGDQRDSGNRALRPLRHRAKHLVRETGPSPSASPEEGHGGGAKGASHSGGLPQPVTMVSPSVVPEALAARLLAPGGGAVAVMPSRSLAAAAAAAITGRGRHASAAAAAPTGGEPLPRPFPFQPSPQVHGTVPHGHHAPGGGGGGPGRLARISSDGRSGGGVTDAAAAAAATPAPAAAASLARQSADGSDPGGGEARPTSSARGQGLQQQQPPGRDAEWPAAVSEAAAEALRTSPSRLGASAAAGGAPPAMPAEPAPRPQSRGAFAAAAAAGARPYGNQTGGSGTSGAGAAGRGRLALLPVDALGQLRCRGLRLRAGVDEGPIAVEIDSVAGCARYSGPAVTAATATATMAAPVGFVLVSAPAAMAAASAAVALYGGGAAVLSGVEVTGGGLAEVLRGCLGVHPLVAARVRALGAHE